MANAIKQISVQRGYDVTELRAELLSVALAGSTRVLLPTHLGMKTVLLHPFAGVLSAYGMGLGRHSRTP